MFGARRIMPSYTCPRNNLEATIDPDSTCDETISYGPGSQWINKNTKTVFVCTDPAESAAVWTLAESEPLNQPYYSGSEPESSTTKIAWKNKVSLTLPPGIYALKWSAEIMTSNVSARVKTKVFGGSIICHECARPFQSANSHDQVSGFQKIEIESETVFYFDYCSSASKKSVSIRRARLKATPLIS